MTNMRLSICRRDNTVIFRHLASATEAKTRVTSMTLIDNPHRIAALPGLLLGLGCFSAAPSAIAAQALTDPGRISLTVGLAAVLPAGVRFVDGEEVGEAALYGGDHFDTGTVGSGLEYGLAAGYRLGAFRTQVELGVTSQFAYEGQSNYTPGGPVQPSEARMKARRLLLSGFYGLGALGALRAWVGAGLGGNRHHVTDYIQRFPNPHDPAGPLRRGTSGEVPYTSLPSTTGNAFAWMLAAGLTVPLGGDALLDFGYRYTDAGRIGTAVGDIEVVRYNEDGSRRLLLITINPTIADLRQHSLTTTLHWLP
ncbi:MAG: outer membrane beta-barrel protein [Gemmatimonadetes bacterium]|nr:outer membrane beta-barrel protein [Gemmatimonadota bacterium]